MACVLERLSVPVLKNILGFCSGLPSPFSYPLKTIYMELRVSWKYVLKIKILLSFKVIMFLQNAFFCR